MSLEGPMPCNRPAFAGLVHSVIILLLTVCFGGRELRAVEAPVWPIPDWQVSTPEQKGMDSAELAKIIAYGKTKSFDSLLITRHGRIVLDAYYAPYTGDIPHNINSATKSVVSSLVAVMREDGMLDSFEHPVLDLFSDRDVANVDDRKKAMTLQHLLDMTSGLEWDEGFEGGTEQSLIDMRRSPDWVKFIINRPMAHAPGEVFYYNSGNSHLLSAVLTKLTGCPPPPMPTQNCSVRSGSHRRSGAATRRTSHSGQPACHCCRMTWQRSAISICAAASGRASNCFRRNGSTRSITPPSA
jgi:hypothetical protein